MIGDGHCTEKLVTYLRFPFSSPSFIFPPRLASLFPLCTHFTTVLLLLRSIHLGWCFPLSPITMAAAAVGFHRWLYNIPREAEAKTAEKKKKTSEGRNEWAKTGLMCKNSDCNWWVIAIGEERIRRRSSLLFHCVRPQGRWGMARAGGEQGASTGAAHCTWDNMSNERL